MEEETYAKLVTESERAIEGAKSFKFRRYLFDTVDKASDKFYNGIYGLRGIGKTVMLLQLAGKRKNSIYLPADAKYLVQDTLYEMVSHVNARGYANIFIDEIHSRKDWTIDLKTLYDEAKVNVFFSGSSSMELKKGADLSRRAIMHELKPASFREYLNIKRGATINKLKLADLYNNEKRKNLAVQNSKWREFMQEYYRYGGVLYEDIEKEFPKSISNSLEKIIGSDLIYLRELDIKIENDIYKLLYKVASSGPYEANYTNLSNYLGISKATVIKLISDLEKVGLIIQLFPYGSGYKKEPKIYLRIPFRYALNKISSGKTDIGAMREEFFANNVDVQGYYKTERGEKTPDFRVGDKIIEVGGAKKKSKIADYIAVDGSSFTENKIPLFLFGFLY
jgi:hypothetical protein